MIAETPGIFIGLLLNVEGWAPRLLWTHCTKVASSGKPFPALLFLSPTSKDSKPPPPSPPSPNSATFSHWLAPSYSVPSEHRSPNSFYDLASGFCVKNCNLDLMNFMVNFLNNFVDVNDAARWSRLGFRPFRVHNLTLRLIKPQGLIDLIPRMLPPKNGIVVFRLRDLHIYGSGY